jgi:hypoxanthine phosphoribosyltransferase
MKNEINEIKTMQKNAVLLHDINVINAAIDSVATAMNEKLADKAPIFLCVMNGAVLFMGQLLPKLNFPLQMDYIHVSRFRGGMRGGDLHWIATPGEPLEGRTVVVIEDILDSGLTLAAIIDFCKQKGAKEIFTAALIDKDHPRAKEGVKTADFAGLKVADKFLIGYGLDYKGFMRNLPGIYAVEE